MRIEEVHSPEVFSAPVLAGPMSADINTAAQRIAKNKKLIGPAELSVDTDTVGTRIFYTWPEVPGAGEMPGRSQAAPLTNSHGC